MKQEKGTEHMTTTAAKSAHSHLRSAKKAKEDEFYTQLSDIEKELRHYRKHFKGKVVYCNCDDPRVSNFFHYFSHNFEKLGLKKLIATCYKSQDIDLFSRNEGEQAVWLEYEGDKSGNRIPDPDEIQVRPLAGNGDFRSEESIELLKQADIVVTNPPFSLFREYISQLVEYDKKFLVLGNQNAITYQEIFPLLRDDKMWLGYQNGQMEFRVPDHYEPRETRYREDAAGQKWRSFGNMCWFTNLDISKREEDLILYKTYDVVQYPSYDNYEAIEVSRTVEIPMDYDGVMGVPITFLHKYSASQFEIVGIAKAPLGEPSKVYPKQTQVSASGVRSTVSKLNDGPALKVDTPPVGKTYYEVDDELYVQLFARVLIRRRDI